MVARGGGDGQRGNGIHCLICMEFQFRKMNKFWTWMVVIFAQQCECT